MQTPTPTSSGRLLLARLIAATHAAIVAYFMVAWALPWRGALWSVVIGVPLLQLGWWLLDGVCLLTIFERRLRRDPHAPRSADPEDRPNFVAAVVSKLVGRPVPERWTDIASYCVAWGGWTVAAARLALA